MSVSVQVNLPLRQAQALEFIQSYSAKNRVPPAYREIADHLGLRGRGRVHAIVSSLVDRGFLVREPNRARALTVKAHEPDRHTLSEEATKRLRAYAKWQGLPIERALIELIDEYQGASH